MARSTAIIATTVAFALLGGPAPATAERSGENRPAPSGTERPYYASDTDAHPEDWQPTHDHRQVRHSIMADCSGDEYQQQLLCVWTPVIHPDLAGYQIWRNGPHRDQGVLVAEIRDPGTTVYWHVGEEPVFGVHGFAIRAVDADGRLLDHTMPFPYRRNSTTLRHPPAHRTIPRGSADRS